mgnify:CR=1 FL=1
MNELDMETKVSYATQFIRDIARQWQDMSVNQQQRLQKAVLPEGIVYDKMTEKFGTAKFACIFDLSR